MAVRAKLDDVKHLLTPEQVAAIEAGPRPTSRAGGGTIPEPPPGPPLPPGSVVCEAVVMGRAVPWVATTLGGRSKASAAKRAQKARYRLWKGLVNVEARAAMGLRRPYPHPVRLEATFYLKDRRCGDTTNLLKALEDGLQGAAFTNDRLVAASAPERIINPDEPERVHFRILAL